MRRVIDAPSTYIQGPGEIKKLAEHYRSIGEGEVLLICSYIHHCKRLIIFSQYKLSPIFPIAFPSYSCYTLL